ncbi:sulfate ABC transporter permease subunit CysW [Cellvibrio japonicus]|uniref:Sulfate ABC transporter, permease protein CysW n=1 Tax=Cellvibrio japonicus (strain Ueda107) TaxID=498211 RepID=B3PJY5_CELJU|nr:sulfate ABC transporter permease subunit CysW [Cellvibrio japonicus]ACE84759.1 sulfate ABC transporter, permease protein CysW [Cellvibrio japonicus Ueda107]QEI12757.1 sulfate ABC transporter permease subunit CysW [Cellvibrio japonicus]QEI16331.1 sulfate ABC transporter permease subunit CysW [Cellvibrio japonicus]QEI19909.1 sulfate ABC transporter permease subunit CysW [Cellvibrio japonicus]
MKYTPRKPIGYARLLVWLGLIVVFIFLILPLLLIFFAAFQGGWTLFSRNLLDKDMLAAIRLTLLVVLITLPVNMVFGIMIAWCVTRFRFWGRRLLIALIDAPYAISPVVAGLCYLLLYGNQGWLGSWLADYGIQFVFAWPGIVLVTVFVTSPYVARELIPLMETQGHEEEEAAVLLGSNGWRLFWQITLPNIKWALLYGSVLTTARAVGEFGSVAVISGSIRGQTNTLPLHVQLLHQDYNSIGAFTAALLLASIALLTLILKFIFEYFQQQKTQDVH